MSDNNTVTVDGNSYNLESLTEDGKALVESLRFVEQELVQAQARIAVFNTAKSTYLTLLKKELPVK